MTSAERLKMIENDFDVGKDVSYENTEWLIKQVKKSIVTTVDPFPKDHPKRLEVDKELPFT
jgi:hypothetical protein